MINYPKWFEDKYSLELKSERRNSMWINLEDVERLIKQIMGDDNNENKKI